MYPRFIEVHDSVTGGEEFINIDSIEGICTEMVAENIYVTNIDVVDGDCYKVLETYEDIRHMIRESGCHIEKGDPRLDTTRPVSWDELTRMENIGQPLFNSNSRRWMLLIDSDSFRTSITLLNDQGGQERWIEHDIKAKPLYRMRREK